jgi:putative sugar O-methyltransferase
MRRVVKALLPSSLHASALRIGDQLRDAGAALSALRRPQDHIVGMAKENFRRASMLNMNPFPPLGNRWETYAGELRRKLATLRSVRDVIRYAQSPAAGVESHLRGEDLRLYINANLHFATDVPPELLEHFADFSASALVPEEHIVIHHGARVDANIVNIAMRILRLVHALRDDLPKAVCDIGGGTGATALAWLRNGIHRPECVTIIDLPETLIFADVLLRHEIGTANVRYLLDDNPIDPAEIGAKVVLCPIANIGALKTLQFDLVLNTLSMQEMTDEWIDWYMRWLDEQSCRYFYSANFFGSALADMREGRNSWSPRPSPQWHLRRYWINMSDRPMAMQLFAKAGNTQPLLVGPPSRLDRWLELLDSARMSGCADACLLQRALRYGLELDPIPKETWHLARALASLTASPWAKATFRDLCQIRTAGTARLNAKWPPT